MAYLFGFLLLLALGGLGYLAVRHFLLRQWNRRLESDLSELRQRHDAVTAQLTREVDVLRSHVERLSPWQEIADADAKAKELLATAAAEIQQAEADAGVLLRDAEARAIELLEQARKEASDISTDARQRSKAMKDEAQALLDSATTRASGIVTSASTRAQEIAGKAYDAVRNAELYEQTVEAMKNIIEGYGDQYLVPSHSLLDDLAEDFSHTQAGQELKRARQHTKVMIDNGTASQCDYVEANRKEMAERFVLDAFNGKVDSILSRVKHDNAGRLMQEIRDAFTLVNFNGKAFRDARITEEFLAARMAELKWAATAQELKLAQQEEQRRIREQIREEEKARRDYERAMREAAKEEEMLRKAMAKAEAQLALATEEQRARFEQQMQELAAKLRDAEERNQRAVSMAQQTRRGHVYIISNVGSFGEDVYKIGLTRRLDPLDRVRELGDASVPFDFDVHAMIFSEDAPELECRLHKHFLLSQVNKVNYRKEFFRVTLGQVRQEVAALGIEATWTMAADARGYRESQAIERAIAADPAAREAWMNRQLTLDPVGACDAVLLGTEE